jgi:hypothetical protein
MSKYRLRKDHLMKIINSCQQIEIIFLFHFYFGKSVIDKRMKIPTRAVGEWWNHPSELIAIICIGELKTINSSTTIPRKNNL